jgi:transcriptional regulator with AAA-type ATPase domain
MWLLFVGLPQIKVYINKPGNIQELKDSIRLEVADLEEEMLGRAMENFKERLQECMQKDGRHLTDDVFQRQFINKLHCTRFISM